MKTAQGGTTPNPALVVGVVANANAAAAAADYYYDYDADGIPRRRRCHSGRCRVPLTPTQSAHLRLHGVVSVERAVGRQLLLCATSTPGPTVFARCSRARAAARVVLKLAAELAASSL